MSTSPASDTGHRWRDISAGLCVAGLLLPEAVAYAGLARLPVAHALTATLVGLLVYALWGGSRFAIVAPTSSTATLAAAAVLTVPGVAAGSAAYTALFMALVLITGAMLVLLALAGQGQLSAFVSRPVLRGFALALALTICIKQLPDALGLVVPASATGDPLHLLVWALAHTPLWHLPSLLVALVAAALMLTLRRWPRLPASLIVILLALLAARAFDLQALGVAQVGALAPPQWQPGLPDLPVAEWLRMGELASGLVVLVFAESWGSVRNLALAHGDRPDANRELMVLGVANLGSALMQGMVVGAGFSASTANAAAGAHSRRAGAVALVVMLAVMLFALPALHLLPRPVLAVAVIGALWHALSPQPLLTVWRMNRDRVLIVGAVLAVLLLGVLHGMLAAIALSLVVALKRFSQPVVHELGEVGSTRNFVPLEDNALARAVPGLLILRPEEPLFFASAERAVADVMHRTQQKQAVHTVILSLEESSDLDSTAVECLLELHQRLQKSGIHLALARVKAPVRELFRHCDPQGLGQADHLHLSVADAAWACQLRTSG